MKVLRFYSPELSDQIALTGKDIAVLATFRFGNSMRHRDVKQALEDAGQSPRMATLYAVINRLTRYDLLEHVGFEPRCGNGRPAHVYVITSRGVEMLRLMEQISDAVS